MPLDLIKRFSPTPLGATLTVNGATLRVATNDQLLLDWLRAVCDTSGGGSDDTPISDWKILVEDEDEASDCELSLGGFMYDGLSFIRISHRSFIAFDRHARCGISFIDKKLAQNEQLFDEYFLPALTAMLAEMKETT